MLRYLNVYKQKYGLKSEISPYPFIIFEYFLRIEVKTFIISIARGLQRQRDCRYR